MEAKSDADQWRRRCQDLEARLATKRTTMLAAGGGMLDEDKQADQVTTLIQQVGSHRLCSFLFYSCLLLCFSLWRDIMMRREGGSGARGISLVSVDHFVSRFFVFHKDGVWIHLVVGAGLLEGRTGIAVHEGIFAKSADTQPQVHMHKCVHQLILLLFHRLPFCSKYHPL